MAKLTIPFVGRAYDLPGTQIDSQTCVNWYLTYDSTGKYPTALLPDPGLEVWTEIADANSVRGHIQLNGILYGVVDNKFYSFDTNGSSTELGTVSTAVGNFRIIPNDNQLFITDGKTGYVYQIIKNDEHDAGDFFIVEEVTSVISQPTFEGAGLDDMRTSGKFSGIEDKKYVVEIDSVASPDTFRWTNTDDGTWNEEKVLITGDAQELEDDVNVTFGHTEGHTLNDKWNFSATIDSSFYVPVIPAFLDGYGVYIKQNSDRFYLSAIDDFSKVSALDSAEENAWPDYLVSAITIREELWLIGRTTTRIWYNSAAPGFPFEPRTNLLVRYGSLAPYSLIVAHNNLLLWLGNNEEGGRVIIMMNGYDAEIISTSDALNSELQSYERVDDAIGFTYQWEGHIFCAWTFPTADKTWVYDLTTKSWHQKTSTKQPYEASPHEYIQGRWRANNYTYFNDLHLVGDYKSGKIFKLSKNTYTEDGEYILNERTSRVIAKDLKRLSIYSLQIDLERGVGITEQSEQGHDPTVMLQISNDDGKTWGNEMWRSIGKTGKYRERIFWTRLGQSDSFTFRIRITDPVYKVVMGAVAEIEGQQS